MWPKSRLVLAALCAASIALVAQEIVFHASAQVVNVTVSITDKNGRPISNVKSEELSIVDDGRPREIQSFHRDLDLPLTLGLVADVSGSQSQFIGKHRGDLRQFLRQVLNRGDRAFLVSIPGPSRLSQDVTDSIWLLEDAVAGLVGPPQPISGFTTLFNDGHNFGGNCPEVVPNETDCGSLIWNGVWASASLRLRKEQGRRAILLLSDGLDTGSEHSLSDVIEAAQSADSPVYTIDSPSSVPLPSRQELDALGAARMRRLSEETGGGYFDDERNLAWIFTQIEFELRHLYTLSFAIPEEDRDGKFHKLVVKSSRAGARVRARSGYVAEK